MNKYVVTIQFTEELRVRAEDEDKAKERAKNFLKQDQEGNNYRIESVIEIAEDIPF